MALTRSSHELSAWDPNWACARPTPTVTNPDVNSDGPPLVDREIVS
jgi:hypothetical protein